MPGIISYTSWSVSVINKGSEGPKLVNELEVLKIIQKVLQSVREPKLAILEYTPTGV